MKFLKLNQMMPERNLRFLLHDYLSGYEDARPLTNIHASALTKAEGLCPRMYALADMENVKLPGEFLSTSEKVTYQIGNDMQVNIVNWFADMGKAVGHWRCRACNQLHEFQKRPMKCKCGCKAFKPEEVRFVSAINGASCGVDCLLSLGDPLLTALEIKTMDKEQFKGIIAPLAEHRLRTNLYLRIIGESDQPFASLVNPQKARVLYTTKGGFGTVDNDLKKWGLRDGFSPFKDYEVVRKDDETEGMARRAKVIKDFRAGEVGMPVGICSTAMAKRAKFCPLRKVCFSGQYPPIYEWQNGSEPTAD
jgi:hypothetical protein